MAERTKLPEDLEKMLAFGGKYDRVLDSIRFRDQDQSTKAGALLTFTGILIATALVQLSVSADSVVHLPPGSGALQMTVVGLFFLSLSSMLSLGNMLKTRHRYSADPLASLIEFHEVVSRRQELLSYATGTCMLGTFLVLLALFVAAAT